MNKEAEIIKLKDGYKVVSYPSGTYWSTDTLKKAKIMKKALIGEPRILSKEVHGYFLEANR